MPFTRPLTATAVAALMPTLALGQSATPGTTIELEPIVIDGTSGALATAEDRQRATPGGTDLLRGDSYRDSATVTLSDVLDGAPGVVVQDFFGGFDQPRVQIRGSGLQQNPVERGVLFLQDGLPLNQADGSYIVGLSNPRAAEFVEVYRGYTANRLGATVLGGALNFVSPTGSSAPGLSFGLTGGSFGYLEGEAIAGWQGDGYDAHLRFEALTRDGFRDDNNDSERQAFNANLGIELTDQISARVFAGVTDLSFGVPGPITAAALDRDPASVHAGPVFTPGTPPSVANPGPNVPRDDPGREATQARIGARITGEFGASVADLAFGYARTEDSFRFPVSSGVRETDGDDFTFVARYAYRPDPEAALPLFEATASYITGTADRDYFLNEAGTRGARFGRNRLSADTLTVSAIANIPLSDRLVLSPGIAWSHATRDNDDRFGAATRPTLAFNPAMPDMALPPGVVPFEDTSYSRTYEGWSPSLALSYQVNDRNLVFGAISRSFEPPTHNDLLATINGTPNSSAGRPQPPNPAFPASAFATPDLEAQTATTVEIGWRGQVGAFDVDAVVYHAAIENELLSLRDVTGASLGAVNAGETTHKGVELGVSAVFGDVAARLAYTYQDFRFDDDPVRGNNRLAGATPHVIDLALDWAATDRLNLGGRLYWRPVKTPVDNLNTLHADPFATLDLNMRYAVTETTTAFFEIRNATDERYAASTLIVDQARNDQAAFIPGDGRSFYIGLRSTF
ncbi:TonB-dependent receptor [Dinoroseobacter shibae DFL 12 = DSM 16493]|jgi:iron complex outermembrane receptor protein|uniref:TonB-dependent receptor n=1 Tax=Dinoroseobacter shibae (strain DSM 16493 / NCIMB 14021 / DFL 12) TaxID=398580 RepID=A8LJG9_DINSH|nr:TonB-dependent receptor [Dinoroseobacter shibae]ABV93191.1 TonB-dependent receptor [Dinoroseobacter shibae DFL 12 = DSM 16493]URF48114.1 TonB-dependent receptor [Dinoroseobacter shibae]URF52424.1 TonB-dependent receptor [Dinoroseobacter shibae]